MQNHQTSGHWAVPAVSCVFLGIGSCGLLPVMSDVPCLRPTAWSAEEDVLLVRMGAGDANVLLLTAQTDDQFFVAIQDDIAGNGPHGPVYALHSFPDEFARVGDDVWDQQDGIATSCSSLGSGGFSVAGGNLELDGADIPVAGGAALNVAPARHHDVVAVLSTNGTPSIPFLSNAGADGQHYHQLHSKEDGRAIGPAVRLGVGGRDQNMVRICWSPEDRFVMYYQSPIEGNGRIDLVCVVDVGAQIDKLAGDAP